MYLQSQYFFTKSDCDKGHLSNVFAAMHTFFQSKNSDFLTKPIDVMACTYIDEISSIYSILFFKVRILLC